MKGKSLMNQLLREESSNQSEQIEILNPPDQKNLKTQQYSSISYQTFEKQNEKALSIVFHHEQANKNQQSTINSENCDQTQTKRGRQIKTQISKIKKQKKIKKKQKAQRKSTVQTKTGSQITEKIKDLSNSVNNKLSKYLQGLGLKQFARKKKQSKKCVKNTGQKTNQSYQYVGIKLLNQLYCNKTARPKLTLYFLRKFIRQVICGKSQFLISYICQTNSKRNLLKNYFFIVFSFIQGESDSWKSLRKPALPPKPQIPQVNNYQSQNIMNQQNQQSHSSHSLHSSSPRFDDQQDEMKDWQFQGFDM